MTAEKNAAKAFTLSTKADKCGKCLILQHNSKFKVKGLLPSSVLYNKYKSNWTWMGLGTSACYLHGFVPQEQLIKNALDLPDIVVWRILDTLTILLETWHHALSDLLDMLLSSKIELSQCRGPSLWSANGKTNDFGNRLDESASSLSIASDDVILPIICELLQIQCAWVSHEDVLKFPRYNRWKIT